MFQFNKATVAAIALLFSLVVITTVAAKDTDSSSSSTCGLYLAVSSTSTVDEPKWGLYAGVDVPASSPVGIPEIAVQTLNLGGAVRDSVDASTTAMVDYLERFFWVPVSSGGQMEGGGGKIITAIPGAGAIGAYNKKLTNAEWNHSAAYFRPSMGELPTVAHANRGAQSHFYHVQLRSKQEIPTGMEIFLNYGDSWGAENGDDDEDDDTLSKDDFDKIDATIDKMLEFFAKYKDELEPQAKAEIYDFLIKDVMGAAAGAKKGRKITSMLPMNADDLLKVKQAGGSLRYSEPSTVRTVEWLENYGRCMDNIRPGASTIPTAGRGAFATRAIPSGGLVSPVPLLQIFNDQVFQMYSSPSDAAPSGKQLLYNYCYGHPESTMLFWPAGVASNFINHAPSPDQVNAKMVWSNHTFHRRHWFQQTPEQLMAEENLYLGLLMEIVATKDIKEGEEVFVDYGKEWQAAWDQHVADWNKRVASGDVPKTWPLRALDLNDEYRHKPFKTEAELQTEPYPNPDVELRCFLVVRAPTADDGVESSFQGRPVRVWSDPKDSTAFDGENLSPCTIVERVELKQSPDLGLYNYTVRWGDGDDVTMVKQVPHKAIVFMDKPNTSDQHVKNAFRHYISIPDDVFPRGAWRNKKAVSAATTTK